MRIIQKSRIQGIISPPISKSEAARALILNFLSGQKTEQFHFDFDTRTPEDISILIKVLKTLEPIWETRFTYNKNQELGTIDLFMGESATALRLMIPILGALAFPYEFNIKTAGKLLERPLVPLLNCLKKQGLDYSLDQKQKELKIWGALRAGTYQLDASISSQFFSGIFFALPLLKKESLIQGNGELVSKPYLNLSLKALKHYGITIEERHPNKDLHLYKISANQSYKPLTKPIPLSGDWSAASALFVAAALGAELKICGLSEESPQGDKALLEFLKKFGVEISFDNQTKSYSVNGMYRHASSINFENNPDLFPVFSVLAAFTNGETQFTGLTRLDIKESSRLQEICKLLDFLNCPYELKKAPLTLIIQGKNALTPKSINILEAAKDHRIIMAYSLALWKASIQQVCLKNTESIKKSYPSFFQDFERLGAICEKQKLKNLLNKDNSPALGL